MTAWLLKTEPDAFSFDDLLASGVEPWDGVTNNTALMHLRAAKAGDRCIVYHTGDERRAVGTATVVREAYPDPKAENPKLVAIDVRVGDRLPRPVSLAVLKDDPRFAQSPLVRISRLSVVPLTDEQYAALLSLGELT